MLQARAQDMPKDSAAYAVIQTTDENEFVGVIVSETPETVVLKTENFGQITIKRGAIRSIRHIPALQAAAGKYWFESPHSTRYFASQNAYGLRKGEGYYENGWIFFNQVTYAFSDHFSMGAGLAPLLVFDGPLPLWLTPKITLPLLKDRLNLAVSAVMGHSFSAYEEESGPFGAVIGQLTVGPRDANLTAGTGYTFADRNWSRNPIFSLSGMVRTGAKFALVSENYLFFADRESITLLSFGGRFMGRRIGIDAAIVVPVVEEAGAYPLPWMGIHVPFGSPK